MKHATSAVVKGIKKGVKILSHELPPNVINPALTGSLRSITDVKEAFKRVGGLPVVAPQIDQSHDMGRIVQSAKEKRRQLDEAIAHFRRAHRTDPQALGRLVDAFLALHNVADRQYRRRIGLNRTQTYSKGWGMAVNGVAATGAVVTATVPVVGQIAGPAIIGATIPLQWGRATSTSGAPSTGTTCAPTPSGGFPQGECGAHPFHGPEAETCVRACAAALVHDAARGTDRGHPGGL